MGKINIIRFFRNRNMIYFFENEPLVDHFQTFYKYYRLKIENGEQRIWMDRNTD